MRKLLLYLFVLLSLSCEAQSYYKPGLLFGHGQAVGPDKPPIAASMLWSGTSHGHANQAARQTAMEPSNAGVDVAFTWAFWIRPSNLKPESNRIIVDGPLANSNFSYSIGLNPLSTQTASGVLSLSMRTTATSGTNAIGRYTSFPLSKARVSSVVITYDGSESGTGLKIYVNGVEDASAVNSSTGTYTGLANDATARLQIGAVASSAIAFGGDLREFIVMKGTALDQTQVTEYHNGGIPLASASLSYYGSVTGHFPFTTDLLCANNATYDLSSGTNIATRNSNFGSSYESLSFFNGYPANTRYLGFGPLVNINGQITFYQNSGTSHLLNKYIVKMVLNETTKLLSTPSIVIDQLPTNSLISTSSGVFGATQSIFVGTAKFNNPTFLDLVRFESTDGATGDTFGSETVMTANLSGYNFYGPMVQRPGTNEWWVAEPEAVAASDYRIYFWKTDGAGTWTKVLAWQGTPGVSLGEPAIHWVSNQTAIVVCRSEVSPFGLYRFYTTDGGANWSAAAHTGLGTGICNAAMTDDPNGNIVMTYMDRATSYAYITSGNSPAGIINSATAWNTPSQVFRGYSTDGLGIGGYMSIVRKGWNYYIGLFTEFSSSRADQIVGVGRID